MLTRQQGGRADPATYLEAQPLGTVELEIWIHSRNVPAGQSLGQFSPAAIP